jgi:hypothetical protein
MEISIGLPNAIHDVDTDSLIEFARRADSRGFTSLGTVDRIVYPNFEPLLSVAAVATATERIRLATTVLLAPLRPNAAVLAKQAQTLDALSGGRFWLGVGLGAREDDYEVSGIPTKRRGAALDRQVARIKEIWEGDEIGPSRRRAGGPELILGGTARPHTSGWRSTATGGSCTRRLPRCSRSRPSRRMRPGSGPDEAANRVRRRSPTYALGSDAEGQAERGIGHYYAWLGEYAVQIVQSAATSPDDVRRCTSRGSPRPGAMR